MPDPSTSLTWAEFKSVVEMAGVQPEDRLEWIDIHLPIAGTPTASLNVSRVGPDKRGVVWFTIAEG